MLLRLSALIYIDERALKRNYVPRLKSIDDRPKVSQHPLYKKER
jgi:hypothetical protein